MQGIKNKENVGSDVIVEGLSLAIHEHRLEPGAKLSEDAIGDIYGVSCTTVRAALQKLANEQLLVVERGRGHSLPGQIHEKPARYLKRDPCWSRAPRGLRRNE